MFRYLLAGILCFVLVSCLNKQARIQREIQTASRSVFVLSNQTNDETEQFAADELYHYLSLWADSGQSVAEKQLSLFVAPYYTLTGGLKGKFIQLKNEPEAFSIKEIDDTVYMVGSTSSTTLMAVYYFLETLGFIWAAPAFDFYKEKNMMIPEQLSDKFQDVNDKPAFKYRKFNVEEGRSHTLESIKAIIDWMPKVGMNTLVFPMNYEGRGEVSWDNWRDELIPELNKRGILIEVGGHGYQNFIHLENENGIAPPINPEWLGMDSLGVRTDKKGQVFCTSNQDAVEFLYANVLDYLRQREEIKIFDFWPPDFDRWCTCTECEKLGSISDRHLLLVNTVAEKLAKDLPDVMLECIAFGKYMAPSAKYTLNKNVLIDFCPIHQSFESYIFEHKYPDNESYNAYLNQWVEQIDGEVGLYSYYRKYAWRSLPNIIPSFMQKEIRYYKSLGINGMSVYCEPGDWFTYGVNHYVFARLLWNPELQVEKLMADYTKAVFGAYSEKVNLIYQELEDIVRFACNIKHTELKSPEEYIDYLSQIESLMETIRIPNTALDAGFEENREKLLKTLQYASKSTQYILAKSTNNKKQSEKLDQEIRNFLRENAGDGIFIPHKTN